MYKTIITFKKNLSQERLSELWEVCLNAFDNRAGIITLASRNGAQFIFEAQEELYSCLQLGLITLDRTGNFKDQVSAWEWIDEDPDECCDVLEELSKAVY